MAPGNYDDDDDDDDDDDELFTVFGGKWLLFTVFGGKWLLFTVFFKKGYTLIRVLKKRESRTIFKKYF